MWIISPAYLHRDFNCDLAAWAWWDVRYLKDTQTYVVVKHFSFPLAHPGLGFGVWGLGFLNECSQ